MSAAVPVRVGDAIRWRFIWKGDCRKTRTGIVQSFDNAAGHWLVRSPVHGTFLVKPEDVLDNLTMPPEVKPQGPADRIVIGESAARGGVAGLPISAKKLIEGKTDGDVTVRWRARDGYFCLEHLDPSGIWKEVPFVGTGEGWQK